MSVALRTPKVVGWRFGANKSQKAAADVLPPSDFFSALVQLEEQESGEWQSTVEDRVKEFSTRLSELKGELESTSEEQKASLSTEPKFGELVPPHHALVDVEEVRAAKWRLEDLESLVGGTYGLGPLTSKIARLASGFTSLKENAKDMEFVERIALANEKAQKVLQSLEVFQIDAIFKPSDLTALCQAYDYAQKTLPFKLAINELSDCTQKIQEMWIEPGEEDKDFDAEMNEIEAVVDSNQLIINQCLEEFIPRIIKALTKLQSR